MLLLLICVGRKRSEAQDLSQLMLTIVQSNRGLANSAPISIEPAQSPDGSRNGVDYAELSRRLSGPNAGTYAFDQPVDMRSLSIDATNAVGQNYDDGEQYMFIPPDPRAYYRVVLQEALLRDLPAETAANTSDISQEDTLLPKRVSNLLSDLGSRWRLPLPSRLVLLLDVIRERFMERIISLDTLDAAFTYFKEPPVDKKKQADLALLIDRTKWPIKDYVLNQQVLASIHDTLLRDLFEQFEHCYDTKPPEIGPAMTILETHIYDDPLFSKTPEDLDRFSDHLHEALQTKASEHYNALFVREISQLGNRVEFFHIIQLGKAVIKFLEKIQKRYRKLPQIMGFVTAGNLLKWASANIHTPVLNPMLFLLMLSSQPLSQISGTRPHRFLKTKRAKAEKSQFRTVSSSTKSWSSCAICTQKLCLSKFADSVEIGSLTLCVAFNSALMWRKCSRLSSGDGLLPWTKRSLVGSTQPSSKTHSKRAWKPLTNRTGRTTGIVYLCWTSSSLSTIRLSRF